MAPAHFLHALVPTRATHARFVLLARNPPLLAQHLQLCATCARRAPLLPKEGSPCVMRALVANFRGEGVAQHVSIAVVATSVLLVRRLSSRAQLEATRVRQASRTPRIAQIAPPARRVPPALLRRQCAHLAQSQPSPANQCAQVVLPAHTSRQMVPPPASFVTAAAIAQRARPSP